MSIFNPDRVVIPPQYSAFWGPTDSNIDFCEHNYQAMPFLAEFWNALSSLPITLLAIWGAMLARHSGFRERRFYVGFFFLGCVGIGSFLFHATLKRSMQILDETPMLWCAGVVNYIILSDLRHQSPIPHLADYITVLTVSITLVYFLLPSLYAIFLSGYAFSVVLGVFLSVYRVRVEGVPPIAIKLLKWAALFYGSGFVVWVTENLACDHLPLWWKLHCYWHLSAGLGTFIYFQFMLVLCAYRLKREVDVHRIFFLPVVVLTSVPLDEHDSEKDLEMNWN